MNEKAKKLLTRLLLAFVLVSIGFACGREVGLRSARRASGTGVQATTGDKVVVYSMHLTIPCITCKQIEELTGGLVRTEFRNELETGRLELRSADFQENDELARHYGVGTSTVVVAKFRDGKEIEFRRLDDVWTKVDKPTEFTDYVRRAIRELLTSPSPVKSNGGGS